MTAEDYAANLQANIEALAQRLKAQRYRAKLVRRCYIPKANGKERPLGIPALEDKLVQLACAKLLTAIYEQDFRDWSDGYRPGRGALEAVRDSPSPCNPDDMALWGRPISKASSTIWTTPGCWTCCVYVAMIGPF